MSIARDASILDLRRRARRRVPRFVFDFVDGGAETEHTLRRNQDAFANLALIPRYLRDVTARSMETTLFGQTYGAPFGIAPMGLLNLMWPGADLALARLAAKARIPHGVSSNASTSLEQIADAADGHAWLQIYVANDEPVTTDLMARGRAAGYEILMVTVDVPAPGKRDRDIRNGFQVPFRLTPSVMAQLALHPIWTGATLRAGAPNFANLGKYRGADADTQTLAAFQAAMITGGFDWDDLKRVRDDWPGRLLVKGILHPQDAVRCVEIGCDGIVVSNHGGRQAAYMPAAIEALPAITAAVGDRAELLIDSGIRRGADVIRARALGASMALLGRTFAYGAGAGGAAGCERAFAIIRQELDYALGQLGVPDLADVDADMLFGPPAEMPPTSIAVANASDGL